MNPAELKAKADDLRRRLKDYQDNLDFNEMCEFYLSCSPDTIQELMTALLRYQEALDYYASGAQATEELYQHGYIARAALTGE